MRLALAATLVLVGCQANEDRPPPTGAADCGRVGDTLARYELGPVASREQRTPVATEYRDRCIAAHVSRTEAECLFRATDTWKARDCVPSMFKGEHAGGDCKAVAARMNAAVKATAENSAIEKMLPAIEVSCEQDHWPTEIKQCILSAKPDEIAKCNGLLSQELQNKMAQRMLILSQHPQQ
jgi:hypothetical protein